MRWKSVLFLLFCLNLSIYGQEDFCPKKCECKKNNAQKGYPEFLKLKCGGDKEKINEFDEIDIINIANEIIQLNMSDNLLTTFYPKVQLIELQKLDLSRNQIKYLFKDQFAELPNLRRLDLSLNQIGQIDIFAFNNLNKLERLRLYQNQLSFILHGTFDHLINLKQLEISNNPLVCDCKILWILEWSQETSVKLISNPKCFSPFEFKGLPLRKLKSSILPLECSSSKSYRGVGSVVFLNPSDKQIVFEGDSLMLQCEAPVIMDKEKSFILSKVEWTFLNQEIPFPGIKTKYELLSSTELMMGKLLIPKLHRNHTGDWNCVYTTVHQNYSKSIEVFVISEETKFCPLTYTSDNKGTYTWPRSIVNNTASITCESLNLSLNVSEQKARYFCSSNGTWENLDTLSCQYVSEPTKILQQFSKVNSSILESSELFRNYTSNLRMFRDVTDLRFAVDTVVNYLNYLPIEQVGVLLVDAVDNLLDLPKRYILETDRDRPICGKLLKATERLASITPSSELHKSNLALEEFPINRDGFIGLKCTWYVNLELKSDRLFYCENSESDAVPMKGKMIEASITIPKTLFHELDQNVTSKIYKILVGMHANNKLFPMDEERLQREDVTSAVVGVKLVNHSVTNLTYPVTVRLRTPPSVAFEINPFTPVRWDHDLNNGTGGWSSEGCEFNYALQDHLVFSCDNFGYFGLLQDITQIGFTETTSKFRFSHPGIYLGSAVLFLSLFVAVMTYLMCYEDIQMAKKAKHCLINMWMAIAFLCFVYVFGIYQTEDLKLCQGIGVALHYFSLCSVLWICVAINCMYKRLSKNTSIELHDDELPSDQPIRKPILGLYLVGWGVAMIICGITAAINVNDYSSPHYCFLKLGPPLSALYIPFAVLSLFIFVFCLMVRCAIYNLDVNGHLSEGTQATENVDLDLLEPSFADNRSVRSNSTKTTSEIEDPEHAPITQLRAYIIFLFMYVFTWLCCAFATAQPFHFSVREEDIFSWLFAVSSILFSAFTLFFYCFARNDVRTRWAAFCRWTRGKKTCFRTRNVSDNSSNIPQIQIQQMSTLPNGNEVTITSRSSSRSSNNTRTNSHNSNMYKPTDLNSSFTDSHGTKINNVNLISLHRQQYRIQGIPNIIENPTSAADVFYNPHQSTVARKFFKRQKRHMMKRTNLTARPQDSSEAISVLSEPKRILDDSSIDHNMFGTNSKVNNTNIHVEYVKNIKQKNLNIFSDSDDFDTTNQVSVENIVKNADRLRKKELYKQRKKKMNQPSEPPTENNMRSVSQQCTLEYSSENISDSILDKTSPDKNVLPSDDPVFMECSKVINRGASLIESFTTEDDPTYCKINEVVDNPELGLRKYDTSDLSSDVLEGATCCKPRLLAEPAREHLLRKGCQMSRASSVSASDLDELYQQIRRGPKVKYSSSRDKVKLCKTRSPCLSDSEISSYVKYVHYKYKKAPSNDNLSDNVETTV